jgi:hypothetical protein
MEKILEALGFGADEIRDIREEAEYQSRFAKAFCESSPGETRLEHEIQGA